MFIVVLNDGQRLRRAAQNNGVKSAECLNVIKFFRRIFPSPGPIWRQFRSTSARRFFVPGLKVFAAEFD